MHVGPRVGAVHAGPATGANAEASRGGHSSQRAAAGIRAPARRRAGLGEDESMDDGMMQHAERVRGDLTHVGIRDDTAVERQEKRSELSDVCQPVGHMRGICF